VIFFAALLRVLSQEEVDQDYLGHIGSGCDRGTADGARGPARNGQVYAIFGTLLLLMMASIAGLSTVFYSRRGMWASLVLVTSPPVALVFEAARRVVLR